MKMTVMLSNGGCEEFHVNLTTVDLYQMTLKVTSSAAFAAAKNA